MAAAGATPNAHDTAEFTRMFTEKTNAFTQAWIASWTAMYWAPWKVAMDMFTAGTGLRRGRGMTFDPLARAWRSQGWSIAGAGLAPVHRAAVANARRLGRRVG